ncbi:MAG TPA: NapC/NirT family cytochrome c [Coriobacteriia bacterium]|nr:NapC/NirT family cytochrome c [Coriobacteriia bacterium]
MTRRPAWLTTPVMATALTVLAVVAIAGGIAGLRATDSPSFCRAACHEMAPYNDAWAQGPHAAVSCVDCHVNDGAVEQLKHKFVALKEVQAHVAGDYAFPMTKTAAIPNERCEKCHDPSSIKVAGLDHAQHAAKGPCYECHTTAGHEVSAVALQSAGIFNDAAAAPAPKAVAAVDGGSANLPGHVNVTCSRCHDMATTPCADCHEPKHPSDGVKRPGACERCHTPGPAFVFAHPKGRIECSECHSAPDAKHGAGQQCLSCHTQTGVAWKFQHATATADCSSCHDRPKGHKAGACRQCHTKGGASWAFSHPRTRNCTSCHARPANHKAGACTTCHNRPGVSWAFAHPRTANCTSCHARPANHKQGACTTCHAKAGASWAFTHPRAGSCAKCHTRPAKHRTGTCSSCHKAGSWKFKHPSSTSTCTSCHTRPAGHRSGSCLTCHKKVGTSWSFTHPTSNKCESCHSRPSGHRSGSCTSCHKTSSWKFAHPSESADCASCHDRPSPHRSGGCTTCHSIKSWAFDHPGESAKCASCHDRPSGHRSGSCTTCHTVKTWTFAHPGSSATCTDCHDRPSGHKSGQCSTCHTTSSWKFDHPSSTACANCHSAPANHYGNSCASCHTPSKPWSSATFSHPSIPGGEHTYKSFACSKCHPSSYSSYNCSSCHDSATGPTEDDD